MIKPFVWMLIFWSLFIVTNTIGDAVRFYDVFHWYGDLRLWHFLKIWWMLWLFLTGGFALKLHDSIYVNIKFKYIKKKVNLEKFVILAFLILWFFLFRLIVHNTFMEIWKTP